MTETYFLFLNANTALDIFPWIEEHVVVFLKKDLELCSWLIHQIKLNQLATPISSWLIFTHLTSKWQKRFCSNFKKKKPRACLWEKEQRLEIETWNSNTVCVSSLVISRRTDLTVFLPAGAWQGRDVFVRRQWCSSTEPRCLRGFWSSRSVTGGVQQTADFLFLS